MKLFNIQRPRWRNILLARVLLFAISIVLSSSGEDVGLHDTLDSNSLATPHRLGNPLPILLERELHSKSAKSMSKSAKGSKSISSASKSKGSKSKGSKSQSPSGSKSGKISKSAEGSKSAKSKLSSEGKSTKSKISSSTTKKSKLSEKSKSGKPIYSSDGGTEESRDIEIEAVSGDTETEIDMPIEEDETAYYDALTQPVSESSSVNSQEIEGISITRTEEGDVATKDGVEYTAINMSADENEVSLEDESENEVSLVDEFMEERIEEEEETTNTESLVANEIEEGIEQSEAVEKLDEEESDLYTSRESVE